MNTLGFPINAGQGGGGSTPLPTNVLLNLGTLPQTELGLIPIYTGDGLGTTEPSTEIQQTVLGISIYKLITFSSNSLILIVSSLPFKNLPVFIAILN